MQPFIKLLRRRRHWRAIQKFETAFIEADELAQALEGV
jgi:hypothetical protein